MNNTPDLEATLRQIVARAAMPMERLEAPFLPAAGPQDEAQIEARLDDWVRALSAGGQREALERFLAWEGLDLAGAKRAVGPVRLAEDAPLPAWAELLGEVLAFSADELEAMSRLKDPEQPYPFDDLLVPFVHLFRQRLEAEAPAGRELLSGEAQATLERGLLTRLGEMAAPTLYAEFQVARMTGTSPLARLMAQEPDPVYRNFVRRMQRGGLETFFLKYAVLARLMATLTHYWSEAQVEFVERLAADVGELAQVFGSRENIRHRSPNDAPETGTVSGLETGETELGRVRELVSGLSDPHLGGRGVTALTFESGLRLVYKPKDVGTEKAYNEFLACLNEEGAPLEMKALRVLNQGSHGWVDYADYASCADEAAVRRYYRRAGALLCLVYALEGSDCHEENLIASGEYPVLIDNETLLHPRVLLQDLGELADSAQYQAYEQLEHSVLHSGLLPTWQVGKDKQVAWDVSGLGGYAGQTVSYHMIEWTEVNTDAMKLKTGLGMLPPQANIPLLNGEPVRLERYREEVLEGFEAMYRFLMDRRARLLATDGPLQMLRGQPVRFVFRATRVYDLVLKQAGQPKHLRDGVDYGLTLEMLARAHLLAEKKPAAWPILGSERRAMQQGDVPFFTARTDGDALILEPDKKGIQERIPGYFRGPSFDLMVDRLKGLDEADLAHQLRLIQVSLHTRDAREGQRETGEDFELVPGRSPALARVVRPDRATLDREALVAEAIALAEGLKKRAIWGADGSVTWIAPVLLPEVERFQLGHLDLGLYDGLVGVALFLAALDSVAPEAGTRDLSLAALHAAHRDLRDARSDAAIVQRLGIGGAAGLGSILYGLLRTARFLDEPALREEVQAAVHLLRPEQIEADEILDIIGGSAGCILGLLAAYEALRDEAAPEGAVALKGAIACGWHLLAMRVPSAAGPRAWPTIGGQLLTGFAHGAAGIAYALLRLYEATGEEAFHAAAEEAITYEQSVFVEAEGNWPDLRPAEDRIGVQFSVAWCHGAPGIGLARLGGLPALDTPAVREDLEVALATTRRALSFQEMDADHMCCGNLGRVDVLFTAGRRLGRPDLVEEARRQAAQVVARAGGSEGYRFASMLPRGVHSPGFFQGAAGIGYQLLRLAYPEKFPSVLLWAQ